MRSDIVPGGVFPDYAVPDEHHELQEWHGRRRALT